MLNNKIKMKVLEELMNHLESGDAEDLRPKPKAVGIEVTEVTPIKDDGMDAGEADEMGSPSDKGPMEQLMADKEGEDAAADPAVQADDEASPADDEELSDEELEELIREHT